MAALTFQEAAAALGFKSRSTLYRLRDGGRLAGYLVPGGKNGAQLLDTEPPGMMTLTEHVARCLQMRRNNCDRISAAMAPRSAPPPDAAGLGEFWAEYGRWEPDAPPLVGEELWQHVAAITTGMLDLPQPLGANEAQALWRQLGEALEEVAAGARWESDRWAAASARAEAEDASVSEVG